MAHSSAGQSRRVAVVVTLPALAAVGVLVAYFRWLPRLPDRLATHFGDGMRADGFTATATFPTVLPSVLVGLGVVLGLVTLAMRGNPLGQRFMSAAAGGFALMLLAIGVLVLHLHLGLVDPEGIRMPGWHVAVVVAGLVVGGGLGWLLAGPLPTVEIEPPAEGEQAPRHVGAAESVGWQRSVRSPATVWIMIGLLPLVLVTCMASSWWILVIHVPVYVLLAAFAWVTVVVDDRGLSLRILGGWTCVRVPVAGVRSVHCARVDALGDFGGWGWRANRTASGFVLCSGPAIYVYRAWRGPLVVTVPEADEAAALLNGLRDRNAGY